jgi:hypothetical protein
MGIPHFSSSFVVFTREAESSLRLGGWLIYGVYNNVMNAASGTGQKHKCRLYLHLSRMGTRMGFW